MFIACINFQCWDVSDFKWNKIILLWLLDGLKETFILQDYMKKWNKILKTMILFSIDNLISFFCGQTCPFVKSINIKIKISFRVDFHQKTPNFMTDRTMEFWHKNTFHQKRSYEKNFEKCFRSFGSLKFLTSLFCRKWNLSFAVIYWSGDRRKRSWPPQF